MEAKTISNNDVIAKLVPGGEHSLAHLSDAELLANTRRLVGKSNQLFAALLIHLAEVETRGIHRTKRCASLYTYCIYELRLSEDAAARRSSAARLVKEFPILFDAIANGELHLTGLLMLGPHLTPENHVEVLGRAKFRTKKEIAKLVRELAPLPQVPDLIEPLGPAPARVTFNPSWEKFVESLYPPVRELPQGERPRDWANDGSEGEGGGSDGSGEDSNGIEGQGPRVSEALFTAPARELPPLTGPQHYQMQFSTTEEHVQLVERAKALLARAQPGVSLGELHVQAMRLLVAALEKKKFAATDRPRKVAKSLKQKEPAPRRRGRYVPAAERRAVFQRDGGRCSYVDTCGERCHETHYLELHHLQPFAHGGPNVASNLTLRCAAHNALAAEEDFGRELIVTKRDSTRHESLAAQDTT